jgi:SAM-dependent methyltransferase
MSAHYEKDYRRLMQDMLAVNDRDKAMSLVVGGNYDTVGKLLRAIVFQTGLAPGMSMVDIGCGSGRLAYALRNESIRYFGFDVVPEMIAYATEKVDRPDWRFEIITDCTIPAADSSIDYVCAFSVFTHLRHEETFCYLREAGRVLKPGGRILFSYHDFVGNWAIFDYMISNFREKKFAPLSQFMDAAFFPVWSEHLGMEVERVYHSVNKDFTMPEPLAMEDGSIIEGRFSGGHSYCLLRKN